MITPPHSIDQLEGTVMITNMIMLMIMIIIMILIMVMTMIMVMVMIMTMHMLHQRNSFASIQEIQILIMPTLCEV